MNLWHWISRNWAETTQDSDAALRPLTIPLPLSQSFDLVEQTVRSLPRWEVVATDREAGTLHVTRQTRIFRWTDDVRLRLAEVGDTTTLHARSQSRVGKGDLGQNWRNIVELFEALRNRVPTS